MAHVAKFTRGATGHMLNHYDRKKDVPDLKHPELSGENYNLAAQLQPLNQLEFLHQRLSEVHTLKRADVNVMCDWVVTLPKDIPNIDKDGQDRFFQASFDFLIEKYGVENVISAYVHLDETQPHMHFAFVPVVWDDKKNREKLSAKEVITRGDLRSFHQELEQYVCANGIVCNMLNEATKEGNKSIAELKRETAIQELRKIENKTLEARREYKSTLEAVKELREEMGGLREDIAELDGQIRDLENGFNELGRNFQDREHELRKLNDKIEVKSEVYRKLVGRVADLSLARFEAEAEAKLQSDRHEPTKNKGLELEL